DRANLIVDGTNFIIKDEAKKESFIKEAQLLNNAASLCRSLIQHDQRMETAFFEAVRTTLTRITTGKKLSLKDINERINELLKHSIKSEGVIDIFQDAKKDFNLFDVDFLEQLANMKQKNLAAELLSKLLAEQVTVFKKTNFVKSGLFSEKLQKIMNSYRNGQISNAEVIEELLKMAEEIREDHNAGEKLGLSVEEKAFYDAIIKPEHIMDFYDNDTLVAITKELTDMLNKSRTIDWNKKESARAGMRKNVKRLLKRHRYPPEEIPEATEIIISQCEMWTDNQ
ncbi:MAG: DUF3387 domain-containing protein, partial [Anaerovoracaceae bacterium]